MQLTRETVEAIADLAKLRLSDAEIELYREQLSSILDYVDRLTALDTEEIPPTATVLPLTNALREDAVVPGLAPQAALANAPETEAQQFKVNAVLDG